MCSLPNDPAAQTPLRRRTHSMAPVLAYIDAHLAEPLSLEGLAALTGLSVWRFATVFRQCVGMAPHRYVNVQRVRHAQALLRQGATLAGAANAAGFCDQSHLSRRFKRECGMTPGQYQSRQFSLSAFNP